MPFDMTLPSKYKDFEERWEWILSFMVLEDLFVHEMLMLMEKRPSYHLATMGVSVEDARIILYYNPDFANKLTDPELRYIVTHEIYHVALHHCTVRLPEDDSERGLWNKAADLAINSLIPEDANRHMPKAKELKGLMPKDFGFAEKLSMEQYIQLLREKGDDGKGGNGGTYGVGQKKPGQGQPGQGQNDPNSQPQQGGGFDDHGDWKDSEIIKEIIRNKIEQLSHREKVWGNMAGDVKSMIMAAQKSYVKWTKYLRHYLGNMVTSKTEATFKRPNRRYGYPYCGQKRFYSDRKLLAVDTSGSVSDADLAQFLCEMNKLAEIQPVDVQCFDHDLQGKVMPFDRKRLNFDFKGRGGTCFEPVFQMAEERHYQSVIMLTDGYASAPERPKHVKDVLWVIVPGGECPVDWGTVVKIPEKANQ
jgi:predicted metal-dependent peptidase